MPTAAPVVTSEMLIGQLTDRLFAVYAEALECEERQIDLKSAERLVSNMLIKLTRELLELVKMLSRKDPFLDWWVDFERDLTQVIEQVNPRSEMLIGLPELVGAVKSLILSLVRQMKKEWPRKAIQVSAKLKEFDSRRVPAGRF